MLDDDDYEDRMLTWQNWWRLVIRPQNLDSAFKHSSPGLSKLLIDVSKVLSYSLYSVCCIGP